MGKSRFAPSLRIIPFLLIIILLSGCTFDSVTATGKIGESLSDLSELFEPPLSEVCAYPGLNSRCDELRKKTENASKQVHVVVAYSKALQKLVNEKQVDAGGKLGQLVDITNKAKWTDVSDDSKDAVTKVVDEVAKILTISFKKKKVRETLKITCEPIAKLTDVLIANLKARQYVYEDLITELKKYAANCQDSSPDCTALSQAKNRFLFESLEANKAKLEKGVKTVQAFQKAHATLCKKDNINKIGTKADKDVSKEITDELKKLN
jgi:hypothetical protein